MNEKELQTLTKALQSDPKMIKAIEKLDKGTGTYKEVNSMAISLGKRIAEEMGVEFSADALTNYLRAGHGVLVDKAVIAQENLNKKAGIGLKPKRTKTPNYKIGKTVSAVAAADAEAVPAMCDKVLPTLMLDLVDDVQKYNADFQKEAGLHPIIRRVWSGSYPSHDTRHTDNCEALAGEWKYGDEPRETYMRHEGCRCTIEIVSSK